MSFAETTGNMMSTQSLYIPNKRNKQALNSDKKTNIIFLAFDSTAILNRKNSNFQSGSKGKQYLTAIGINFASTSIAQHLQKINVLRNHITKFMFTKKEITGLKKD